MTSSLLILSLPFLSVAHPPCYMIHMSPFQPVSDPFFRLYSPSALQSISFAPRVIQLHKCACIAGISALPALFLIHVFMKDPSLIPFVNIKENLTLLSIIARRARERDDHTHCKAEKHMID